MKRLALSLSIIVLVLVLGLAHELQSAQADLARSIALPVDIVLVVSEKPLPMTGKPCRRTGRWDFICHGESPYFLRLDEYQPVPLGSEPPIPHGSLLGAVLP